MSATVTRFAPSPTGPLHLGHALAALVAHDLARAAGGSFRLRIDDIDTARCRPEYVGTILADLDWLGLRPDGEPLVQSGRREAYREALGRLAGLGLTYPCFCTRRDIAAEVARLPVAPHGPEGPVYPGTCRELSADARAERLASGPEPALRLDSAACARAAGSLALDFTELGRGPDGEHGIQVVRPELLGDVVLARRDLGVSYHLACVVDDAAQGITIVSRGEDLFTASHVQRLLQAALGLPAPAYHHHRLVRDAGGRRLAKRDAARTLAHLRAAGIGAAAVRAALRRGTESLLTP
jgi:glutamyl-Q tRNA(Asp) synthetase